jgi:hypothetical protein
MEAVSRYAASLGKFSPRATGEAFDFFDKLLGFFAPGFSLPELVCQRSCKCQMMSWLIHFIK